METAPALAVLSQHLNQDFASEVALTPIGGFNGDEVHQVDLYFTRKGFTVADLSK
jgi:hypothetical protein